VRVKMGEEEISSSKALELIDQKISGFHRLLKEATRENKYGENYTLLYGSTEALLTELYSEKEVSTFRRNVTLPAIIADEETIQDYREFQDYKDHIQRCIAQLKVYRERIQSFWKTDKVDAAS
jgi:bisphosphoglycerate-dependent phosphoglycerate mutase